MYIRNKATLIKTLKYIYIYTYLKKRKIWVNIKSQSFRDRKSGGRRQEAETHFCTLLYLLNSERLMTLGGLQWWVWVSFVMSTCSTVFHSLISKGVRPRLWNQLPDWICHLLIRFFFQCLVGFLYIRTPGFSESYLSVLSVDLSSYLKGNLP